MYINQIVDKNVGPLKDIKITCPFNEQGNPKPIIIVGENGAGKSTLLSNIVDAIFEIAALGFNDAKHNVNMGERQYYKAITGMEISFGESFMYSYISFKDDRAKSIEYVFKSGELTQKEFKERVPEVKSQFKWDDKNNVKKAVLNNSENIEDSVKSIFGTDVICYFEPSRYEKPFWLGDTFYDSALNLHPSIQMQWEKELKNPIIPFNMNQHLLPWLLDVIVDSRMVMDVDVDKKEIRALENQGDYLYLMGKAKKNVEIIMSQILGKEIEFGLNFRNYGGSRFNIKEKGENYRIVTNSLDGLSTGQSALFDLFATIVKYADNLDINHSIQLNDKDRNDITGIVVIDEIELHLHSNLQRKVVPKLIKLFPKVQFVITTHAPLFLLGMEEEFGPDGYAIYQMPEGKQITAERFSEFKKAYNYLTQTETYENEIEKAIAAHTGKMLVVTEGSTDWKHMKAAYNALSAKAKHNLLFQNFVLGKDFEFLEYESKESTSPDALKIEMGNSALESMCQSFSKIHQDRKIVFIADRDKDHTNHELSSPNQDFKIWGNNVYSFILPLPDSRKDTPSITIEHLYSDEVIKTEVAIEGSSMKHRLYMGNEFKSNGFSCSGPKLYCQNHNKCGPNSIAILDGSKNSCVVDTDVDDEKNVALSKSTFANMILNREKPLDNIDFSNFIKIFEIFKEIEKDKQ